MIGINPSPSSQFVPAALHKPHGGREGETHGGREGGVSGERNRIRSGLRGIKVPHLALY